MSAAGKAQGKSGRCGSYAARRFGVTRNGDAVFEHILTNANGVEVRAIDYGAVITCIAAPDRNGVRENVVLGYDHMEAYEACPFYIGAVIGRYAGRIKGAAYREGDALIALQQNANGHCLHGGFEGFGRKVWSSEGGGSGDDPFVEFACVSSNGEGGFPGDVTASVRYTLTPQNELAVAYEARCTAPTHVNLTQHSYFNLSGDPQTTICDHELTVAAARRLDVDHDSIPTGAFVPVAGAPFDFRQARAVGDAARWLDHDFVIDAPPTGLRSAGSAHHPESGRRIDVATDQPALHVYAGAHLRPVAPGRFIPNAGLCLETQHYPNTPNVPAFPSTRLAPGEVYRSRTVFTFSVV